MTEKVPQTMIDVEDNFLESDEDIQRRHELRSFLMGCRSRLAPAQLGLPPTGPELTDYGAVRSRNSSASARAGIVR